MLLKQVDALVHNQYVSAAPDFLALTDVPMERLPWPDGSTKCSGNRRFGKNWEQRAGLADRADADRVGAVYGVDCARSQQARLSDGIAPVSRRK